MSSDYLEFLKNKSFQFSESGFDVRADELPEYLFPFQRAIVKWALRRGKAAIFADTGLGKTFMQLSWAWEVFQRSGNRVLILAPLCVAPQTISEAEKLGIPLQYVRDFESIMKSPNNTGLFITNYENLDKFPLNTGYFDGIVLDESSIIKHKDSKTRNKIIESTKGIPYRLSCTATPSPNDFMELGNQAEFLGIMRMTEMLSMFFIHDSGETSKWRLKGHGRKKFWEWLATWSMFIKRPSDIGFSDDGYVLPELNIKDVVVETGLNVDASTTLSGRNAARKLTIDHRVEACARLVNSDKDQWIVWCHLNEESEKLENRIEGSVQVYGSMKAEEKEREILSFTNGETRVLVTKPSIAGFGLNWQHCHKMAFVGLNDSFEEIYQAIRRCYRFGQKRTVEVAMITSDAQGAVSDNIKEKERKASEMSSEMVKLMRTTLEREIRSLKNEKTDYEPKGELEVPGWLH